jgi:serine/threonine protein phosphatase PrpC
LQKPGLAMTRTMGDQVAHSIGVTNLPEVQTFKIDRNDKFIVIGSKGLWQSLDENVVGKVAYSNYIKDKDAERASSELLQQAEKAWKARGSEVDDITIIVIFLKEHE